MSTAPYPAVSNLYWAIPEKKKKTGGKGGGGLRIWNFQGLIRKQCGIFKGDQEKIM